MSDNPSIYTERRAEPHHRYFSPIEFALESNSGKVMVGTTINISDSGLGLYSYIPLSEGQEIRILSAFPGRDRTYSVRWVIKLLEDFFIVGLQKSGTAHNSDVSRVVQPS